MLTMNCDRCGNVIEFEETKDGKAGRDRWKLSGKDVIVDLCPACSKDVKRTWLSITEDWETPPDALSKAS